MLAHASSPSITVLRVAILASDDKNPNSVTILPIEARSFEEIKFSSPV